MLQRGTDWLAGKLNAHASHMVTYVRGDERLTLSATFGQTAMEAAEDVGPRVDYTERDFLLRAADLVLGGLHALPRAGDRIEELVDGKVYVFEVMAPEGRELPFRWSDATWRMMRAHAKLVRIDE
jgi:hypothetical protein